MPHRIEQPLSTLVRQYRRLSPTARRAVWALLAFEVVLIGMAERDIQRRPAERIRGPEAAMARSGHAERDRAGRLLRLRPPAGR